MWQHYYYWYSRYFTPHLPLFAHGRCIVLVTTGHRSLIIRIIAYHSGDHSLKIQGFIGIVALQGSSGSTATVFIRWPYSLHTFDRVLRTDSYKYHPLGSCAAKLADGDRHVMHSFALFQPHHAILQTSCVAHVD
jgi:hypothetical protein